MKNNLGDRIKTTDDFWDIEKMLPERKPPRRFSNDTDTVEIKLTDIPDAKSEAIPPRQSEALDIARKALKAAETKIKLTSAVAAGDRKHLKEAVNAELSENISEPACSDEIVFEYSPERNPLIKKVTVKPWDARYTFYERFRADAEKYHGMTSDEVPHAPFFSYTPQYAQLSKDQLCFYLYWRSKVREGKCFPADYAYVLLYVFEIINLPNLIPPKEGAVLLCRIWRAYREKHISLDRIIPGCLCDYCLIGKIDPPTELFSDFYTPTHSGSFLREYYAGYDAASPSPYAAVLFACASDYNYRTSKFITNENRELFDKHIKGAFIYAFSKVEKENKTIFAPIGEKSTVSLKITRDAFSGTVCAYNVKKRIEIEYLSCSRSVELRFAVTDMIKYAENGVRSLLGIRSRFHTPNLAMPLRQAADEYFAPLKKALKKEELPPPPEYEKLYESLHTELSLDYAKRLEEKAWQTTGLLVNDGNEELAVKEESEKKASFHVSQAVVACDSDKKFIISALEAVLNRDMSVFSALAAEKNFLPDTLAEEINERFFEEFSDAVIENTENGFEIIPFYREDIIEWMKK